LQYYDGGAGDDGGRPGLRCEEKAALFLVLSWLIKQLLQRTQANGMSSEGFTDNAIQKAECGQKEYPVAAAITGSSSALAIIQVLRIPKWAQLHTLLWTLVQ